ncbi:hypothetical protein K9M41_04690 [Candidatus Gracilibacteria bacterium]|nr:hypothetical protein [Candidatus Gracilibacteria bacterium]
MFIMENRKGCVREEMESYKETILTLSDPEAMQALAEAERDWKEGKVHSFEDVFGE